jgi:tRNA threonylcarbamoyladenosine biosynthesis protein TsaE
VIADLMPDSRTFALADAAATEAFGVRLGRVLRTGDTVFLSGPLGAGKTTLARGVIGAWTGLQEEAPSPTYTLVQTYEGPGGSLWHVDLYRLKREEEAWELGLDDAFATAVCLIEWPDRLGANIPSDRLEIALAPSEEARALTATGFGAWEARLGSL